MKTGCREPRVRTLSLLRLGAVLCALLSWRSVELRADQRELQNTGSEHIDAVLLLDSSGSMRLTDPARLRDEGARLFVQFLKPGDHLAVAEFSEQVQEVRPLSPYDADQESEVTSQIAKIGSSGTYTDIAAAIQYAKTVLETKGRPDAGRVIILLSDGKMDPHPSRGPVPGLVTELVNNVLPDLKSKGIKIHSLSFSDQADKDQLSQIALGTDGVNWFTPTADKIHESYAELFLVVKKPQIVPLSGKGFTIDEDIEEATFYVNREDEGIVTLISPSGTSSTAAAPAPGVRWYSGAKFDVITVDQPEAGKWEISGISTSDGFATVLTNLKLLTEWPSAFSAHDKVLLQARLYEEQKPIKLPSMTGVVSYAYQITPTDKVAEPIVRETLVDDGTKGDKIADDGIFSSAVVIKEPGEYKLRIAAKGPTFQRYQHIPFRVKPRMISLAVIGGESAEAAAGHGAHGDHAADAHGEKGHAPEAHHDEHAEHGEASEHGAQGAAAPAVGSENDQFAVTLGPDAAVLKQLEVKLLAIDGEKRRFNLPLVKSPTKGDTTVYLSPAKLLPGTGSYALEASFEGRNSKRDTVNGTSETLTYTKSAGQATQEHVVQGEHGEHSETLLQVVEEKVEVPESPLAGLAAATVINLVGFVIFFVMVKKSIQGGRITLPDLPSLQPAQLALAGLKQKLSVTELNINDPMFSSGGAAQSGKAAAEAAPAEAAAPDGESAPPSEGGAPEGGGA